RAGCRHLRLRDRGPSRPFELLARQAVHVAVLSPPRTTAERERSVRGTKHISSLRPSIVLVRGPHGRGRRLPGDSLSRLRAVVRRMGLRAGYQIGVPPARNTARRPSLLHEGNARPPFRVSTRHDAGLGRGESLAQSGARPLLRKRVERDQPLKISRRLFLSAALVGLSCKGRRGPAGGFVDDGGSRGHRLRLAAGPGGRARGARKQIVIVGGGIAGLSAAWRLHQRGVTDFVVLEMETRAGGNARWGEHEISRYPWAAHYVPIPGPDASELRTFFRDLGVLEGDSWIEQAVCFAPQERLYIHGRWQEGLEPQVGPTARDRDQFARFDERMRAFRETGAFTIPSSRGRRTLAHAPEIAALDTLSMAAWLDREGFDSPYLRWWVEYGCRDDYGALLSNVSAWAGVHYHASRPLDEKGPLTWPEGNGWIARRLLERLDGYVETSVMVERLERNGRVWIVTADNAVWTTENVIYAAPAFLLPHLSDGGYSFHEFEYSPWLTANLVLDRWPRSSGVEPAWDNV